MHRQATYMLSGTLSFKCFDDPGPHYEAYGYLDIEVMGKTFEIWSVAESHPIETRNSRSYVQPFSCLLYTSPSPRDATLSRMPSSA